ncbi:hypothetical protein BC826DRAFT_987567 [Russula brevipes]|nr:hypothetical protein BC826DRAFT_987567 [Russula brevipes]
MPRRKPTHGKLQQQSLVGFLKPDSSKTGGARNDKSRRRPGAALGAARLATRVPPQVSEPSDESDADSGIDTIHFEPKTIVISDDGDDHDVQPSSPTRRRRAAAEAELDSDNGTSTSSNLDESIGINRRATSTKIKRPVAHSPSTEPESSPKRRRLARVRPSTPEESDDLLGEVNEADILQSRFRDRQKRTAFQKKLDKLKKKKLGVAFSESSDEQTGDEEDRATPFQGSQRDSDQNGDDHGDDDGNDTDDFVVQDDGAVIPELPMAFSLHSHQDASHDFKIVCQLLVHLAMMSMDERRTYMEEMLKGEHYFSVPFQVICRKVSGTRDSIASSVWRHDYRKTLELYPDLTLAKLDFAVPHCDACHLGGRKSTVSAWLKGIPYDKVSFEPIIDESDSEDLEDGNSHMTSFSLGRFCAVRTQIFHRLSHWIYHLYRTLSEEVDLAQQPRKKRHFKRLAYAKNLPPPEDTSNPDDVMEWLDQRGVVSAEWQKLSELLERASNLDASAGKKEEDIDLDV